MDEVASVPVAVAVVGPARGAVLRVVEGALGWLVVAAGDAVLPPRCVLADVAGIGRVDARDAPVLLLVDPDDDPVVAATAARRATAVVRGVPDPTALQRFVAGLAPAAGPRPWCTVAASSGGVGATTVAAALAGLRAWRHGPTLLAARGPTHTPGAPVVAAADLASPATWPASAPARGVERLRVVGLVGPAAARVGDVPTVVELGVGSFPAPVAAERAARVDVLVVRPDAAGRAAAAGGAGVVVAVGRGPVDVHPPPDVPLVSLPTSARVAAAAGAGRCPADLPGTWLRPLLPLVAALEREAAGDGLAGLGPWQDGAGAPRTPVAAVGGGT